MRKGENKRKEENLEYKKKSLFIEIKDSAFESARLDETKKKSKRRKNKHKDKKGSHTGRSTRRSHKSTGIDGGRLSSKPSNADSPRHTASLLENPNQHNTHHLTNPKPNLIHSVSFSTKHLNQHQNTLKDKHLDEGIKVQSSRNTEGTQIESVNDKYSLNWKSDRNPEKKDIQDIKNRKVSSIIDCEENVESASARSNPHSVIRSERSIKKTNTSLSSQIPSRKFKAFDSAPIPLSKTPKTQTHNHTKTLQDKDVEITEEEINEFNELNELNEISEENINVKVKVHSNLTEDEKSFIRTHSKDADKCIQKQGIKKFASKRSILSKPFTQGMNKLNMTNIENGNDMFNNSLLENERILQTEPNEHDSKSMSVLLNPMEAEHSFKRNKTIHSGINPIAETAMESENKDSPAPTDLEKTLKSPFSLEFIKPSKAEIDNESKDIISKSGLNSSHFSKARKEERNESDENRSLREEENIKDSNLSQEERKQIGSTLSNNNSILNPFALPQTPETHLETPKQLTGNTEEKAIINKPKNFPSRKSVAPNPTGSLPKQQSIKSTPRISQKKEPRSSISSSNSNVSGETYFPISPSSIAFPQTQNQKVTHNINTHEVLILLPQHSHQIQQTSIPSVPINTPNPNVHNQIQIPNKTSLSQFHASSLSDHDSASPPLKTPRKADSHAKPQKLNNPPVQNPIRGGGGTGGTSAVSATSLHSTFSYSARNHNQNVHSASSSSDNKETASQSFQNFSLVAAYMNDPNYKQNTAKTSCQTAKKSTQPRSCSPFQHMSLASSQKYHPQNQVTNILACCSS